GILNTGNLSGTGTYFFELNGTTTAGTDYDQISATATSINLTGATLAGSLGYSPTLGDSYTIIKNNNNVTITGNFAGAPEGSLVTIGGSTFAITYTAGVGGHDVKLTRANNPTPSYDETLTGGALVITMTPNPVPNANLQMTYDGTNYVFTDLNNLVFG